MADKICYKCGANLTLMKGKHRANCPIPKSERDDVSNELTINPAVVNPLTTNEIGDDGGGVATMDKPEDPGNDDYPDSGDVDVGGSD